MGICISSSSGFGYGKALALWSCSHMWFSVNAIDSSVSSRFFGVSSHSHTVMQCQPIAASLRCSSLSLLVPLLVPPNLSHPELPLRLWYLTAPTIHYSFFVIH